MNTQPSIAQGSEVTYTVTATGHCCSQQRASWAPYFTGVRGHSTVSTEHVGLHIAQGSEVTSAVSTEQAGLHIAQGSEVTAQSAQSKLGSILHRGQRSQPSQHRAYCTGVRGHGAVSTERIAQGSEVTAQSAQSVLHRGQRSRRPGVRPQSRRAPVSAGFLDVLGTSGSFQAPIG